MSIWKKITGYIPIILVMFISASALVPGYFINKNSDLLDTSEELLYNTQVTYDWVVYQQNSIFTFDSNIYTLIWQELDACKELDVEWTSKGENRTETDNITFAAKLFMHFGRINVLADQTNSFGIHIYFTLNPNAEEYLIGLSSTNMNYSISRIAWETHPVYITISLEEFLNQLYGNWYGNPGGTFFFNETMDFLDTNYATDLQQPFNFLWAEDTLYTLDHSSNLYNLTYTQLLKLENNIEIQKFMILDLERIISDFQNIVSIMTIATLMSTAISARLEERKLNNKISLLRSDLTNDKSLILPEADTFTWILLIIAVLIAAGAILYSLLI